MGMSPKLLRPRASGFDPRSISGLALWLDAADGSSLYTTDAGPVTAVSAPTEISGCALWLDADDLNSMTLSGSNVSEWRDKSGAGSPAASQAVSANRPQRAASSLNGRATIEFDDADSLVFGSSTAAFNYLHNATGATMFVVWKPATTSNPDTIRYLFNNTNNASGNTGVSIFMDDRSSASRNNSLQFTASRGVSGNTTSSLSQNDFFTAANSFCIMSVVMDNANATAASRLLARQNGVLSGATNTAANAAAATNASFDLTIGNFGGGGAPAAIAEIIFYQGVTSTTDRARVEAYLSAKWGIAGVHAQATATNDPVGYWRDKSGNGRHLTQSTGTSRPALRAANINGKRSVTFDGVDDNLWRSQGLTSDDLSMFCVYRYDSISGGGIVYDTGYTGDQTNANSSAVTGFLNSAGVQVNSLGQVLTRLDRSRSGVSDQGGFASAAGSYAAGRVAIATAAASYGGASPVRYAAFDGAALSDSGRFNGATWSTINLGCRRNGASVSTASVFLAGQVCEFIAYDRNLPVAQRQRLERYLASKWGITLAPQVSNADAQDWVNRVYANGGTVSPTTASAVNTFCNSIDAAGLRDRFYRLNLFCGTGLAACLVPLYRGPSLGGTQYGSSTDTNNGPFVSGDYAEDNGLLGNASSKYLNTGFNANTAGLTTDSVHMSAVWPTYTQPANSNYQPVSITNSSANERFWIVAFANTVPITAIDSYLGQSGTNFVRDTLAGTNSATVPGGLWVSSRTSVSSLRLYNGSTQRAELTSPVSSSALPTTAMTVFVRWDGTNFFGYSGQRLRAYSVGLGMTAAQVASFNAAMTTLQSSLGRA
jgi:hypothetical protein